MVLKPPDYRSTLQISVHSLLTEAKLIQKTLSENAALVNGKENSSRFLNNNAGFWFNLHSYFNIHVCPTSNSCNHITKCH